MQEKSPAKKVCACREEDRSYGVLKMPIHFLDRTAFVPVQGWLCRRCGRSEVTGTEMHLTGRVLKELDLTIEQFGA